MIWFLCILMGFATIVIGILYSPDFHFMVISFIAADLFLFSMVLMLTLDLSSFDLEKFATTEFLIKEAERRAKEDYKRLFGGE